MTRRPSSLVVRVQEWCRLRGYNAKPATYLAYELGGLNDGDARLVRFVAPAERAAKDRTAQRYTIEVKVNNELTYPLGTEPKSMTELLAAMKED